MKNEVLVYSFHEYIDAPLESVYEYMNKDEHVYQWNSMIEEHIYEGNEEEIKAGSTYKSRMKLDKKEFVIETKIIKHEPPYHAEIHGYSKEGVSITRYWFERDGHGTTLTVEASLLPKNFLYKWASKLFKPFSKLVFDEQYKAFVQYVYTQESKKIS
ncbi:SRPBCC family protein [Mangrovibacillus cuniculi]|uniref:SRPBCC family protein n=1 Tax=Mangrovibacillus cuniculi TaxID=2593652 RepID=A0A7S8CDQ7_9BACI|nr:SRPBCC family protein [Mangrovibacillus cuniculi]QPC48100.1 SRPBCC family protein [Mangrovibacillus cuniculi]